MEPFTFSFSQKQLTRNERLDIGVKDIFSPENLLFPSSFFPNKTQTEKDKKKEKKNIVNQKSPTSKSNQSKKTTPITTTTTTTSLRKFSGETKVSPKTSRTKHSVTFASLSLQKSAKDGHQTKTREKAKTSQKTKVEHHTKSERLFDGSWILQPDFSFSDFKGDPFSFPLSSSVLDTRLNKKEEEKAKISDKDERFQNSNSSLVLRKETKSEKQTNSNYSNAKDSLVLFSVAKSEESAPDLKGQIECKFWSLQKVDKFCFLNMELEKYLLFPPREIIFDESLINIRKHCDLQFTEDFLNVIRTQTLIPSSILKNAASLDHARATKPQSFHLHREKEREEAKRNLQQKVHQDSLLGQGSFGYVYSVRYRHPESAWAAGKIRWKPKTKTLPMQEEESSDEDYSSESKRSQEKRKNKENEKETKVKQENEVTEEEAILKVLKKKKKEATAAVHPFLTEGLIGFVTNAVCPRTTIEFLDVARSASKPYRIGFVTEKYPSTLKHFWLHNPASGDPEQTFLVLYHISSHLLSLQNSLRFVHGDLRSDNTVYRSVSNPTILNPQEAKSQHILSFWDVRLIDLGRAAIFWRNKTWSTWDLLNKHKTFENFNFDLAVFCSDLYLHILGFHPTMIRFERLEKGFCKKMYDKFSYLLPFLKYILEGVDYSRAAQDMKTIDPVPYVLQQVRERDQSLAFRSHPKVLRDLVLGHLETIRKKKI